MADSPSASPAKLLTPPRPCAVAKPASVPPAPASRPAPPLPMKAAEPVKTEVAKAPEPPIAIVVAAPVVLAPAPAPVAAPPVPVAVVAAPAPAPEQVVVAAPPSVPAAPVSSPRRTLLSIVTWDAFRPEPDPLALAKLTPAVTMRRARFTKYVKGVVAGCAGLCLIALVRVAVASASEGEDPMHATAVHKVHEAKTLVTASEERAARTPSFAAKTATLRHR